MPSPGCACGAPDEELPELDVQTIPHVVRHAAIFSTWVALRKRILEIAPERSVILDLSPAKLVDHTVMEKLHELQEDFQHDGRFLLVIGLEEHRMLSKHPQAARKKVATSGALTDSSQSA